MNRIMLLFLVAKSVLHVTFRLIPDNNPTLNTQEKSHFAKAVTGSLRVLSCTKFRVSVYL